MKLEKTPGKRGEDSILLRRCPAVKSKDEALSNSLKMSRIATIHRGDGSNSQVFYVATMNRGDTEDFSQETSSGFAIWSAAA